MADNRIAYGLAKKHGIDTKGMSPQEVWEALKEKGITPENAEQSIRAKEQTKRKELEKKFEDDLANTANPEKKKVNLTQKEFASWYQKIGEIKRGGYVDKMSNGNKLIPIGNKIVVTAGTYEKPKAKMVFEFESEEKMFDYVNRKRKK